jgi:hypothetical protein
MNFDIISNKKVRNFRTFLLDISSYFLLALSSLEGFTAAVAPLV